jgi:hypothetical protein
MVGDVTSQLGLWCRKSGSQPFAAPLHLRPLMVRRRSAESIPGWLKDFCPRESRRNLGAAGHSSYLVCFALREAGEQETSPPNCGDPPPEPHSPSKEVALMCSVLRPAENSSPMSKLAEPALRQFPYTIPASLHSSL